MAKTAKTSQKNNKKQHKPKVKTKDQFIESEKPAELTESKLPGSFRLMISSLKVIRDNWKLFLGIVVVYGLVSLLLGQSLSSGTISQAKASLDGPKGSSLEGLLSSAVVFASMSNAIDSSSSGVPGAYQVILIITASLAIIWALRQVYAKSKVRIRDAYYRGMYPLVPFTLLMLLIIVQLLPIIVGLALYGLVKNGVGAPGFEMILWAILVFLLIVWSLYMLTASLVSLYIVCLPDMAPMAAFKSARELVKGRRWTIMRKVIFLPFFLFIAEGIIIIPIIFLATPLAQLALFLVAMADLVVINSYMYRLYRELL